MLDPKVPGAIDKIINLGDLLDENKLKKHKNEIIKISNEISETFKRTYRYLNAAKAIHEDWSTLNCSAKNYDNLYKLEQELKITYLKKIYLMILKETKDTYSSALLLLKE
ncbi:hypothetical protein JTT08_10320 [Clostridium botulinum]|nr:hypothetical protein [Clostridium botulinum]